ncbi:ATP-binding protein [Actinomadura formosensis]|uniref:ATP-binding protein n=1 Tax=Actinomadura formosensis TaxID=60706 RepID=UPI003D8D1EEC
MNTTDTATATPAGTAADGEQDGGQDGGQDGADGAAGGAAVWALAAETRAASRARDLTARTLRRWHVTDPAETGDIVLMVDELVTNAVVHGTGPVRLALCIDGAVLTAEVGDADPAAPAAPAAPPGVPDWSEGGRGLLLVAALATEFGARPAPPGKTVWFTRHLTPRTAPAR